MGTSGSVPIPVPVTGLQDTPGPPEGPARSSDVLQGTEGSKHRRLTRQDTLCAQQAGRAGEGVEEAWWQQVTPSLHSTSSSRYTEGGPGVQGCPEQVPGKGMARGGRPQGLLLLLLGEKQQTLSESGGDSGSDVNLLIPGNH